MAVVSMITFLQGHLVDALPTQISIDVQGVGYEVLIPVSSFDKLPAPGQPVKVLTHLVVREDAHLLYGFMSAAERDLFRLLINSVSGIGPKTALNILSGISVMAFRGAVASGDVKMLSHVSGVGKKTAERIIIELKDKMAKEEPGEAIKIGVSHNTKREEALSGLVVLGFARLHAAKVVDKLLNDNPNISVESLIKESLRIL